MASIPPDNMSLPGAEERARLASLDRAALERHQLARLNALLAEVLPDNRFYAERLAGVPLPLVSIEALSAIEFTRKDDLVPRTGRPLALNHTWPPERYVRMHQTSGTRGRPLAVLDTAGDWQWWLDCWQYVLDAAGVTPHDCLLMAFSFGPFIGFWTAYDAAARRGCLVVPGGGLSTAARLELLADCGATVVCCTPSYALRLAEVAAERRLNLAALPVHTLLLAGEPGGSIPSIRQRIEQAWGARAFDHAGATEVGAWGFHDASGAGLHVLESEFIAEFISTATGQPAADGELAELVITNLGRRGCPVLRYRTGDLVRPLRKHDRAARFVLLEGGVLGRCDDMMVVRGVNVFPSSLEEIIRGFPEVAEYRITASKAGAMDELTIEVEDALGDPRRVAERVQVRLGLRVQVNCVAAGSLPRFEGKGRRFVDNRPKPGGAS